MKECKQKWIDLKAFNVIGKGVFKNGVYKGESYFIVKSIHHETDNYRYVYYLPTRFIKHNSWCRLGVVISSDYEFSIRDLKNEKTYNSGYWWITVDFNTFLMIFDLYYECYNYTPYVFENDLKEFD